MAKILLTVIVIVNILTGGSAEESVGFQSWVNDPRSSFFPTLPNVAPRSKDELCKTNSELFLSKFKNRTSWAVKMWEASAKDPEGVLAGKIFHLGNYDECIKIVAPIKLQYCLVQVAANISSPYNKIIDFEFRSDENAWTSIVKSSRDLAKVPRNVLHFGLCVPATCSSSDLQEAIQAHLDYFNSHFSNETTFNASINEEFCTKADYSKEFTTGEILFWSFLGILIILTVSSTLVSLLPNKKFGANSNLYTLWMFFSAKENFSHLVPLEVKETGPMDVFHGIKFLSILVVIFGHRVGIGLSFSAANYEDVETTLLRDHKMFFTQSDLVVDTFFFISGLLACYVMMGIFTKQFINPILAIFVRIYRLAPVYFFIMWFQATAAYRLGSGPVWKALAKNESEYCVQNWWTNVLFISNYVKTTEMCMPHSWFLPCELHFFSLAAIIVPLLARHPKYGKILLAGLIFISALIPAFVIYFTRIPPLVLFYYDFLSQPRHNKAFNLLYINSHNRASVYLIGVAVGYFLYQTKNYKKLLSVKITLCGCIIWLGLMFAPMAYGSLFYDLSRKYSVVEAAIFASLRRISWAIAFAVFILSHRFGTIPYIDLFLSSRLAIFLSRITYGIYLLHFYFVTTDVLTKRTTKVFTIQHMLVEVAGDVIKSALATVILIFIFETPIKRIAREFIFAKQVNQITKSTEVANNKKKEIQNVFTIRL